MAIFRKSGLQVSVWKFQTAATPSFLFNLQNAELVIEVADEDAAGIADIWDYAWAVGKRWQVNFDELIGEDDAAITDLSNAYHMELAGTQVVWTWNSGANLYSGTGLFNMATHRAEKRALQKQRGSIKGQGALTITPPV